MTDNKLISALVSDLAPIKVKKPIRTTVVAFGISSVGTLFIFGTLFSVRSDLQEAIRNPAFLFSTFAALIICFIGFFSVLFMSTPGRETKYFMYALGASIMSLFLLLLMWPNTDRQGGMTAAQGCTMGVIKLGLLSLFIFGFAAKKMAPTRPGLVGFLCGIGAACVGMTALAFYCPSENPLHLLIWH